MMRTLPPDQFITNHDGSIYHLEILPEQLADTIITCGDPQRVTLISKFFDEIEFTHVHREFVISTGSVQRKRITVISTGMGTQNVDVVLNELDALVNIDFNTRKIKKALTRLNIYRFGTCGAIQPEIEVGDFIVATQGIDFTGVMNYYAHEQDYQDKALSLALKDFLRPKYPQIPVQIYPGDNDLIQQFKVNDKYHLGLTATCNGFYASQGRKLRLDSTVNGIIDCLGAFLHQEQKIMNLEMETGSLYGLGRLLNHRCCTVNVALANRTKNTFNPDVHRLVEKLIETTLEIITRRE